MCWHVSAQRKSYDGLDGVVVAVGATFHFLSLYSSSDNLGPGRGNEVVFLLVKLLVWALLQGLFLHYLALPLSDFGIVSKLDCAEPAPSDSPYSPKVMSVI